MTSKREKHPLGDERAGEPRRDEPRGQELRACAAYADRLVDLSDGELPEGDRAPVESHVASCPGCRAELARLDASLVRMRERVVLASEAEYQRPRIDVWHSRLPDSVWDSNLVLLGGGGLLAMLILGGVLLWSVIGSGNIRPTAQTPNSGGKGGSPTVRPGDSTVPAPQLSEEDVLRHIALVEQQARLQASLDLMPDDPWFADQRAANEKLLAKFKEATAAPVPRANSNAP